MKITIHKLDSKTISEIISDQILIRNEQDALDLYGEVVSEYIILNKHNFDADFFDLSTRKLGEVLQKFTNFQVKLAIIGNFNTDASETFKDFIYESNRHGDYLFVSTIAEVLSRWK